jgi:hypothetical protein
MEPEKLFSLYSSGFIFLFRLYTHTLQSDAVSLTILPHATHASVIRVHSLKSTIFFFCVLNSQLETEPLFCSVGLSFHLYSAFNLFPMDEPCTIFYFYPLYCFNNNEAVHLIFKNRIFQLDELFLRESGRH